jgi:hypothetical protein
MFESQEGLGIFLYSTASRPALGPTRPPSQWVPGAVFLGVKRLGRETRHSPPSIAEVNNAWSYTYLVKHRDNFTFAFGFAFWTRYPLTDISEVALFTLQHLPFCCENLNLKLHKTTILPSVKLGLFPREEHGLRKLESKAHGAENYIGRNFIIS